MRKCAQKSVQKEVDCNAFNCNKNKEKKCKYPATVDCCNKFTSIQKIPHFYGVYAANDC